MEAAELVEDARLEAHPWTLPVGISDSTLKAACFELFEGDHITVTGPPRSGKSTALEALAFIAKETRSEITISAIALRGSPLRDATWIDRLATTREDVPSLLDSVAADRVPQLVLIDDADGLDDADGRISRMLGTHATACTSLSPHGQTRYEGFLAIGRKQSADRKRVCFLGLTPTSTGTSSASRCLDTRARR